MRSHLRAILVAALTVGLLAFFFRNASLRRVWVEMQRARLDLVVAAVVVTMATYVLRAARWQYLLRPIGRAHFFVAFRTTVIGFAASFLLPARAGEFLRPYLLARREGLSATAVFATIILERLLDLVMVLLLFGSFVLLFDPGVAAVDGRTFSTVKLGAALAAVGALVALAFVFVVAGHPDRVGTLALGAERVLPRRLAESVARSLRLFAKGLGVMRQPGPLAQALALSVPLWLTIALGVWLVTAAFHIALPFTSSFLLLAVLVVGVSIPTPGAIGGFHAAYQIAATAFFGAPNDQVIGAALVLHAVSFVPVTAAGLVFMVQDGFSLAGVGPIRSAHLELASTDTGSGWGAVGEVRGQDEVAVPGGVSAPRAGDEGGAR